MEFVLRDLAEADLDQCLALATDGFLYDAAHRSALRAMWSHLIASGSGVSGVVADARLPSHVAHFFTAAFVTDERAGRFQALVRPAIAYRMVEEWAAGDMPFLTRAEIARANAGRGLNLVAMQHGYEEHHVEADENLRAATYESARRILSGWNLRAYTNEVFARNGLRDGKEMGEALGFRVKRYTGEQLRDAGIPPDEEPWVWLATREDAVAHPAGLALALLFLSFSQPRFGFDDFEQQILRLALDGYTDAGIARIVNASLTTTKKHFRLVYEKVQQATGGCEALSSQGERDAVRGAEMRRHLLNYVRNHPEELHPYAVGLHPKAG